MFAGIKNRLGIIDVMQTPTYIVVSGVNTYSLFKDMYSQWGSNVVSKHMFSVVRSNELKMRHFFGLDFLYVCRTLYDAPRTRTPRRILAKMIHELEANTWLGSVDRNIPPITNLHRLDDFIPFPWKPYQTEFIQLYGKMVPAYRLKGYMLDAGPGTGKTLTNLGLAEALSAEKTIIISPKNAVEQVWENTIKSIVMTEKPYWHSLMNREPSMDDHYYVVHYESLERMLSFVKANSKNLHRIFVGLDESHNFNRLVSDRTQLLVELCRRPEVSWCNWASGTPLLALGSECIPFLMCIDPLFDSESEERFRKIYGKDAKRANDILRNRMGHLKYHVPKQDVVEGKPIYETINITIPNGNEYTLDTISEKMRRFVEERQKYYEKEMPFFKSEYALALEEFTSKHLRSEQERAEFRKYQAAFKVVSSGYDPRTMKDVGMLCNAYENKVIIPTLSSDMKPRFRKAKSIVKYPQLVVMGEALGGILGKARTRCNVEIAKAFDFSKHIDNAKKKTLIFTSYVEVVDEVERALADDYKVAKVYGDTNKNLNGIVKQFYNDPDLNPLVATYMSLSTAVPLVPANLLILLNQPFRSGTKEQTVSRAHRLGQDEQVYVLDVFLDTGAIPNISTRSNDIMEWSAQQVASIMGINNVDVDTLALEAKLSEDEGWTDMLKGLDVYSPEYRVDDTDDRQQDAPPEIDLPQYLYHGSQYLQDELKPGFQHSGELVSWDGGGEDNTWLYATASKDSAIMLGIASAIEKNFRLDRYQWDEKTRTMTITTPDQELVPEKLRDLKVYLYTLRAELEDGWVLNFNPINGITDEYKTQATVRGNILRSQAIDVKEALHGVDVRIKRSAS